MHVRMHGEESACGAGCMSFVARLQAHCLALSGSFFCCYKNKKKKQSIARRETQSSRVSRRPFSDLGACRCLRWPDSSDLGATSQCSAVEAATSAAVRLKRCTEARVQRHL